MKDQNNKSEEFIQQKYIQLLEKSYMDLSEKRNPFSQKNIIILSSVALIFVMIIAFFIDKPQLDIFKDHLLSTSYNADNVLIETKTGIFYQISENTNKKWLADNGVFISVSPSEISFTATQPISKKWKTTYTLWVPDHKQYKLTNIDGSTVFLNSKAKLTFANTRLTKSTNAVLIGEALFNITHDTDHPYTIKASNLAIEVFGTEFSISNNQNNDYTQLALINGSVKIKTPKDKEQYITPGQQATLYKKDNKLIIDNANFPKVLAWKTNQLFFKDESLENIAEVVGKWHQVDFLYTTASLKTIHFTGRIKKVDGLLHFLEMIQYTEGIHYEINKNIIKLSK